MNEKMADKVVWVINQFAGTPESGWGERHFYLSKYWIKQGYKVRIISGSFNHMFKKMPDVTGLFNHEVYEDVDFYWVKTPKYNPRSVMRFYSMIVFMRRVLRLPLKELGKPDTIIVSSMPIFPIYSGIRLKKKFAAKLLFEIRDIWPLTLQLLGNKSAYHPAVRFIGWFEKIGYRKSDCIVSLLPNAQEHIEEVAGKKVDFHYLPNGIDPDLLKYEPIDKELKKQIPSDKFIVGYAGTLGLANALEFLVEASKLLKDHNGIQFLVVGEGYLKEELMESVKGNTNIMFLPKIPKNQVQDLLTHFDACFVGRNDTPLFKHGVSANKYFDYMLAGKPILDSNNYIKDPVELSGCGIIVKPDSAAAIQAGILKLYEMKKEDRQHLGSLGRDYVTKNHSIRSLAEKYIQLF